MAKKKKDEMDGIVTESKKEQEEEENVRDVEYQEKFLRRRALFDN